MFLLLRQIIGQVFCLRHRRDNDIDCLRGLANLQFGNLYGLVSGQSIGRDSTDEWEQGNLRRARYMRGKVRNLKRKTSQARVRYEWVSAALVD